MSKLGAAFTVNDVSGAVTSSSIGAAATLDDLADDTTLERNSADGTLRVKPAGATGTQGIQRASVSKFAGTNLQGTLSGSSDSAGGILNLVNPYGTHVRARLTLLITAKTSGACTADFGAGSTTGTLYDTLMDGVDLNVGGVSAPFIRSSLDNSGTNGAAEFLWQTGHFITGSTASGAVTGLVGTYAIEVLDLN